MQEFILFVIVYLNITNTQSSGFQMAPMGEYPSKAQCQEYAEQIKKDLAEPGRTIRATCMPKSAMKPPSKTK